MSLAYAWQESALRKLDERLSVDPDAVHLLFERACLLAETGRTLEAKNAYLDLLAREPTHRGVLNNLGTLLYETHYRTAARTVYGQAVACHPNDAMCRVNLANMLREDGELAEAREHYETALRLEPEHPQAHQGLSYVLTELGEEQRAGFHRRKGFQDQPIITLPYYGEVPPVSLLLLISAVGGNTPTQNFLDSRIFQTFVVVTEFCDPHALLPPHQFVFNAISDADLAAQALIAAQAILTRTTAPVINLPAAVLATGRVDIAQRFSGLSGVVTPKTVILSRELLSSPGASTALARHGFEFPILLRTPGFHTGRHFLRVERADALTAALTELPGDDIIVMQYIDTRGTDGKVRKYRVMMINGKLYPLHLAVSGDWKVHYFTSELAHQQEQSVEEAAFLENMQSVLGARAMTSLASIQAALGLDYAGIDFGLSVAGEIVLFEANATMVVNPPEPNEQRTYRHQAVERIDRAVRTMLMERVQTQL